MAWLQPMSVAKSGWKGVNPAYEEIYQREVPVGTPPPTGAGWVYPALFRSGDTWLLVSEGSLPRNYSGSRLRSTWLSSEYAIEFPDPLERIGDGPVNPESTLPWLTPWRFVVIGTLKTIVESTLGTDLADKPASSSPPMRGEPGKASWSWPLLGDDQTTFEVQKRFVDYAADMRWSYTLVDGLWDQQIGDEKLKELVEYAKRKGVRILVWYNSAGDWNFSPQTPRNLLLTRESRSSIG
jgi:alpha-glucosidase